MCKKVYYIELNLKKENMLYKWCKRTFNLFDIEDVDENKHIIKINNEALNNKLYDKIVKKIKSNEFKLVVSNKIQIKQNIPIENQFSQKELLKKAFFFVIEYIEKHVNGDFRNESVYVTVSDDKNIELISELSEKFKDVNIVTDRIKKLYRMEKKLSKKDGLIFSIQNNKKKSLRRAKFLINFDYDSTFFESYCLNRNCIILNLYADELSLKNSFHGVIIEKALVDYDKNEDCLITEKNFNKEILYTSYISDIDNKYLQDKLKKDCFRITALVGKNAQICDYELKNNYTKSSIKLDKLSKKD